MKLALLLSLITGAAAFAPAKQASTSTALSATDYSSEVGVTAPLGLWDPWNILDTASDEKYARLRATELKHGRVAMLGVVGYLVTYAGVRMPGLELSLIHI